MYIPGPTHIRKISVKPDTAVTVFTIIFRGIYVSIALHVSLFLHEACACIWVEVGGGGGGDDLLL